MKLIHLSDLHLGKRVNGFSMLEDQAYILDEILRIIDAEQPDAVLIAGDLYDKPVPPTDAVALLDSFLVRLAQRRLQVLAISGNHDSAERLSFGGRLMAHSGLHLTALYHKDTPPVTLTDAWGPVHIYLLPFVKPAQVRRFFPEREISTYTDAAAAAIEAMQVDPSARNVLVTHQFVTGAARCDSEELSVGGADNVDAAVFAPFDYVALGHLHGPQQAGRETVRYCGTPLKYSFSEAKHRKSVTVAELGPKGEVSLHTVPLTPRRDLRELRGSFADLTGQPDPQAAACYLHITLTDEDDIPDAASRLRAFYPYLMRLDYDNARTRAAQLPLEAAQPERLSPLELLDAFYEKQNGQPMRQKQRAFVQKLMEEIWEGEA